MSMPAWMAWYRNTVCIASRTGSLPRNENDTLVTPPLTSACGRRSLDPAHGLDEVHGVVVVLLDAGGDREDVRVEDDVLGREADLLGQQLVGSARRSRPCARACRPGPARRRPSPPPPRRSAAPCAPARGTRLAFLHADRVDDRPCPARTSGPPRSRSTWRSRSSPARARCPARRRSGSGSATIAASESSMPSSMLTSMICAPVSTCCLATSSAAA